MNNPRGKLVLLPILGVLSVALYGIGLVAKGNRETYGCQSNLKQIGLGLKQYERDYDEKAVLADNWKQAVSPWVKNDALFDCPSTNGYAFNRYVSGVSHQQITDYTGTPTVFDSTSKQLNAADFGTSYVANGAHPIWRRGRGTNVLFFDGHVKWMQKKPLFRALKPLVPIKLKSKPKPKPAKTRAAR